MESFQRNPIPPLVASILIAPFPYEPVVVPSSLIIWIVWDEPASAWSLMASATFSFAVIIVFPPSAHNVLESFQCNAIPPWVDLILIEPVLSEPSIVPILLVISIISLTCLFNSNLISFEVPLFLLQSNVIKENSPLVASLPFILNTPFESSFSKLGTISVSHFSVEGSWRKATVSLPDTFVTLDSWPFSLKYTGFAYGILYIYILEIKLYHIKFN